MFIKAFFAAVTVVVTTLGAATADETLHKIYLDQASPEKGLFAIAEWPSFLFTANAPVLMAYRGRSRIVGGSSGPVGDLDCSDVAGPVDVSNGDPNGFDADGDGIGCE